MKCGVLGTGMVGKTIASGLVAAGHEVRMGARDAANVNAATWTRGAGARASHGTFAEAAAFGELVFNCTLGTASLQALRAAGAENLRGKVLVDLANPLDASKGMPPILTNPPDDSLGEKLQRAFPDTKVVKTLNTVYCGVMVQPGNVGGGDHHMFVCGDDAGAKAKVTALLRDDFGWKHVVDLGDITAARGMEGWLPLWLRLWGALGTTDFNLKLVR